MHSVCVYVRVIITNWQRQFCSYTVYIAILELGQGEGQSVGGEEEGEERGKKEVKRVTFSL